MARKPARKAKGRKTPSRRAGGGTRAARRTTAGRGRSSAAKRTAGRRATRAKATRAKATRKAAKKAVKPARAQAKTRRAARGRSTKLTAGAKRRAASPTKRRAGGTGREQTLGQTPDTGRSVKGPTNPFPTKRSTGTAAGAGNTRRAPGLERERKQLREVEEGIPGPPSSLNMDRHGSAARTGRAVLRHAKQEHTQTSPAMTGGDVDADWEDAYAVGDEAPGGDNPTPDQDRVDDIGKALGVEYQDNEPLKGSDKISERDKHRWELDPASAEDYTERD